MRRFAVTVLAGVAIAVLSGGAALAGGWATSELDEPLGGIAEGKSALIGFTVLQHGVTPAAVEGPGLRFTNDSTGEVMFFEAEAQGAEGHYVASVARLPAGSWDVEVEQGEMLDGRNGAPSSLNFGPYLVGRFDVAPATATAPVAPEAGTAWWPFASIAAVVVFVALSVGAYLAGHRSGGTGDGRLEYVSTTEEAV